MSNRFVVVFEGPPSAVEIRLPTAPADGMALCEIIETLVRSAETDDADEPRVPVSVRMAGLPHPYVVEGFHADGRWWIHEVTAFDRIDADFQGRWRAVFCEGRPVTVAELALRLADVSVWSITAVGGHAASKPIAPLPATALAQTVTLAG